MSQQDEADEVSRMDGFQVIEEQTNVMAALAYLTDRYKRLNAEMNRDEQKGHASMDGRTMTVDEAVTVYTEKSLEMMTDHPLYFAAWLVLEAAHGAVLALEGKISARLQEADRKDMTRLWRM